MAQRAGLGAKVKDLFAAVGDLSRWCLANLKNDRADARFVHAFPKPVSDVLEGVVNEEKLNDCMVAIDHVRAEPSFAALAHHLDAAQALLDEVCSAQAALNRSLPSAREVHNLLFPKLTALYPNREGFVSTFFLDRDEG